MTFSNGAVTIPITADRTLVLIVSLGHAQAGLAFRGAYAGNDERPSRLSAFLAHVRLDSENLYDDEALTEPSAVVNGQRGLLVEGTLRDLNIEAHSPLGESIISLIAGGTLSHAAAVEVVPRLVGEALIADDRLIEAIDEERSYDDKHRPLSDEIVRIIEAQEERRQRQLRSR